MVRFKEKESAMIKFVVLFILSVFMGIPSAEAGVTILDKIKGLFFNCEKMCQVPCTQPTLQEQKECWQQRDYRCSKTVACEENEKTANNRGNTQSLEVLEQIYNQVPQVRYYFDEKQTNKDKTKLNELSENERNELKESLEKGVNIILNYCNKSISEMEVIKNPKLPPEDVKRSIDQFKDIIKSIEKVKDMILKNETYKQDTFTYTSKDDQGDPVQNTDPFTKYVLKAKIIAPCLLGLKNIANQGGGFKWRLEHYQPSPEKCNQFCNFWKCLENADLTTYCKAHCNTCNNVEIERRQQEKATQPQERGKLKTPVNASEWTNTHPSNPIEGERKAFGSAAATAKPEMAQGSQQSSDERKGVENKAANQNQPSMAPGKSGDLKPIPPLVPPRPKKFPNALPPSPPKRFPEASPPPLPPLSKGEQPVSER